MWPTCFDKLSPKNHLLPDELIEVVKQKFRQQLESEGKLNDDHILIPIRLVSFLGECTMMEYLDCPNTPEHHLEYLEEGYDAEEVKMCFEDLICDWVDFDIIGLDNQPLPLRMVFNWGNGDTNDGFWGAVWERNTEELIANILSTGDCETTIEAVSGQYVDKYESQDLVIPKACFDDPASVFSFFLQYANKLNIEALIGLALYLSVLAFGSAR